MDDTNSMTIITPTANEAPSSGERLFGAHVLVHEDMRWREHVMTNEDSLIKGGGGNPNYFTHISSRIEFNAFNTLHGIQCIEYHVLYTMFDYYHVNCDLRPLNCNPETNKLTFDFP